MNVAILGAGQTGRGFLGRLAFLSGANITFIDRDAALVDALRERGEYEISFFGGRRGPLRVSGYAALHADDDAAIAALIAAELILTCVLVENLGALLPVFARVLARGGALAPILVCENGVDPSSVLRAGLPDGAEIAEAVLLCTTYARGTDIVSQDLDYLPYDVTRLRAPISLAGFSPEARFAVLQRRKIYTYNCLSALICYLGAEKGYEGFEVAAVDPEINAQLLRLRDLLDRVIAREYGVSTSEQAAFSKAALDKFTSPELGDSIVRNARSAHRKLGRTERIIAPMLLARAQGEDIAPFVRMVASAMRYGVHEGTIDADIKDAHQVERFLAEVCGVDDPGVRGEMLPGLLEGSGDR